MRNFRTLSADTISGQLLCLVSSAFSRGADVLAKLGFAEVKKRDSRISASLSPRDKVYPDVASAMTHSTIRNALKSCRGVFLCLGVFSGVINILMLTGSFFMLQVYDRVLPSQSVPTLVGLAILATALYVLQGALELIRNRVSVRIGAHLDQSLSSRVYDAIVRLPLKARGDGDGLQPLRDLDYVRSFLSGGGPAAFFDLPWLPIYLGICFLFHFWIGVTALVGSLVLVTLALLTEVRMREPTRDAARFATTRTALAAAGRRNAEVMRAMGMGRRVGDALERDEPRLSRCQRTGERCCEWAWWHLKGLSHDLAIGGAWGRRLSCHPSGIDGRYHNRKLDFDVSCARAR